MKRLRVTLLSDGNSDHSLIYPLEWALKENGVSGVIESIRIRNAELPARPKKEKRSPLAWRIHCCLKATSCDLLCVHRDAERETMDERRNEIRAAALEILPDWEKTVVCIVPVRMQEAWLLFHEDAIRYAASNPNGKRPLDLPRLRDIENLPDPKDALNRALLQASGKNKRRRSSVDLSGGSERIAQYIEDFSPLRVLSAFAALEAELKTIVTAQGWDKSTP